MAKESGIGDQLYVAQFDLTGDVGSVGTLSVRRALLDVPGLNDTAASRILGQVDGEISFNSWWNTVAGASHLALSTQLTTDRVASYLHGSTAGNASASIIGKQINYDQTRGQDGSLASNVQVLANGFPLEWGVMLTTGKQTFASAAVGSDVDDLAGAPTSTAFGAAAYVHAMSLATGTATIAVQDAATLPTYTDVTGLVFPNYVSGGGAYLGSRLQTATGATIRRYLRVNVTGSFTNLVAVVTVVRYLISTI